MTRKNIGFVSYYGFGRGMAYYTLMYVKMLANDHNVFVLKQGNNKLSDEFLVPGVKVLDYKEYFIEPNDFIKWITDNKLDAVVLNEYNQWLEDKNDLIDIAHKLGIKVYGALVMEKFKVEQTYKYDRILVPTISYMRFLRQNKIRKFTYVPYSLDLVQDFPALTNYDRVSEDKIVFYHPGGWGGYKNRKNTELVVKAFEKYNNPNTKLIITSQLPLSPEAKQWISSLPVEVEVLDRDLPREEQLDCYKRCDIVVLPSKWETIGIPILEALACGKPVITSDMYPMNEFIRPGTSGLVVGGKITKYDDISIDVIEVDLDKLVVAMENMNMSILLPLYRKLSRKLVEEKYDIEKNKHYFLDFLESDLK